MTKNISTDAEIDTVRLTQQGGHPSSPSSGYESLYVISGSPHGGLYVKDSAGKQIGPFITGSPAASGAPTDGEYVTSAANASLGAEVVIPGLAGSADIAGAGGAGTSEEYDTSTTGITWSPSSPTTVDSDTTIKSHLYILGQADTTERLGTKSWGASTGTFDVRVKGMGGAEHANTGGNFALHIGNSGNTVRLLIQMEFTAGGAGSKVQCYTYEAGSYTARGTAVPIGVNQVYFRITRGVSNDVKFYWSTNGIIWQWIGSHTIAITVDNLGYRIAGNAGGTQTIAVDWLRTSV
jgi:hypothetical protein